MTHLLDWLDAATDDPPRARWLFAGGGVWVLGWVGAARWAFGLPWIASVLAGAGATFSLTLVVLAMAGYVVADTLRIRRGGRP